MEQAWSVVKCYPGIFVEWQRKPRLSYPVSLCIWSSSTRPYTVASSNIPFRTEWLCLFSCDAVTNVKTWVRSSFQKSHVMKLTKTFR